MALSCCPSGSVTGVAEKSTKTRIETARLPLTCDQLFELQKSLRKQGLKLPTIVCTYTPDDSCRKVYENKD